MPSALYRPSRKINIRLGKLIHEVINKMEANSGANYIMDYELSTLKGVDDDFIHIHL